MKQGVGGREKWRVAGTQKYAVRITGFAAITYLYQEEGYRGNRARYKFVRHYDIVVC